MVKVLIVEDSSVVRQLLVHILEADTEICVIGTASNGQEALEFIKKEKPDVITMDIVMPVMDGLEATRRIMETDPVPIVVISASWNVTELDKTFLAIQAGALSVIEKPVGLKDPKFDERSKEIIRTVKTMSEVKLVTRIRALNGKAPSSASAGKSAGFKRPDDPGIIAIGASTGGPPILKEILSGLPKDYPIPLAIVQHITPGFLPGLAGWLTTSTGFPVKVAAHGEQAVPGCAYLAPDDSHLGVLKNLCLEHVKSEPENGMRPAVSFLFRSVARNLGAASVGILLTGMGRDGADGLKLMRDSGAVTVAQEGESCVVNGMPGEAVRIGAACEVMSPGRIVDYLLDLRQPAADPPKRSL